MRPTAEEKTRKFCIKVTDLMYNAVFSSKGNVHVDALMQKRRNSIANALALRLFCIKLYIYRYVFIDGWSL